MGEYEWDLGVASFVMFEGVCAKGESAFHSCELNFLLRITPQKQ